MTDKDNQELAEAIEMADAHMDAIGVPENSINRDLIHLQLALNQNPGLLYLMREMWPNAYALTQ
jgi:hypothetical protein